MYLKYLCTVRQKNGFIDKLRSSYEKYTKYVVTDERFRVHERRKWNEIVKENFAYMVEMILKSSWQQKNMLFNYNLGSYGSTMGIYTNIANR